MNPNKLSYWYPKVSGVVPTPLTEIISAGEEWWKLCGIFDSDPEPAAQAQQRIQQLAEKIRLAAGLLGGAPVFLRTGEGSGKHSFENCCALFDLSRTEQHIVNLIEWSEMVSLPSLAYDEWVVREWLPGSIAWRHAEFGNMPVRREFRAFATAGEVHCLHPYWPPHAFTDSLTPEREQELQKLNTLTIEEYHHLVGLASIASQRVEGSWSLDLLEATKGWYLTDMAVAEQSYHWPECPERGRFQQVR